jgi:uncharacterized protein (DUF58 family)
MNDQRLQPSTSNGSTRRVLQVTREGWRAIALTGWVLASALISHASLTLLAFCMLLAALCIGAIQTIRNLRRIEATRRLPEQAMAGRPFHVEFDVRNHRLFGTAQGLLLKCDVHPTEPDRPAAVFLPAVPARGHVSERIELVLSHRGLYRFGELSLSSRFPFGFVERSLPVDVAQELLVYPRLGKLNRRFLEFERESHPHQEGRRPGPAALEADYHGLREFRDGDSPRWIHWPTSARRGGLMVREFEARQNRDVLLLLDPWIGETPTARDQELLELAISFTATVCVELCKRQSIHLVLGIASDPFVVVHGESSQHFLRDVMRHLSLVQGTPNTAWDELLQGLPPAWTNLMRITAVSPRQLNLAERLSAARGVRLRSQNLAHRIVEVDVARPELRDAFEIQ